MCIRDRYVVEELVEAGIKDIIIIGSSNKRAIEDHFDTPNDCLLYTSDAADERSSVDLGGRRIIKKQIDTLRIGDDWF